MGRGGVLDGIRILDVSTGIAGAMATMLLSDHGADTVGLEPAEGRSFGPWAGRSVWLRSRRSVVADPATSAGGDLLRALASGADLVVADWRTDDAVAALVAEVSVGRPELIQCNVDAYGPVRAHAGRAASDALVAARIGLQWDQRGAYGGVPAFIAGVPGAGFAAPDVPATPADAEQTGHREGPIYQALPWPSIGAALLATVGISAALRAREITGLGQVVSTSLLSGALLTTVPTWQRVPDPTVDGYRLPYFDRRHPKGLFRCRDGSWLHQWAPILHGWIRAAADGEHLRIPSSPEVERPEHAAGYDAQLVAEVNAHELTAAAVARFDRDGWIALFAEAGLPCQPVRSPEEGLRDPWSLADGCVAEVDDPELGPSLQVGTVYRLHDTPAPAPSPAPRAGADTDAVRLEVGARRVVAATGSPAPLDHALTGVTVLDLGIAMAGPYGTQTLADLGATVIKIHNPTERFAAVSSPTVACNRGKRSLALDLKDPRGTEVLHRLTATTDVVHHNLRIGVAERLQADDATLRARNPRLIYCHTRGFEASGPRAALPGNDQMGQALAGSWWEMGGMADGGAPAWHPGALGDFGNGVASAIAVIQALYHRERTGLGQRVDTSILNLGLLYNSSTWLGPDGCGPARSGLDAAQLGFDAWHRLYRTADGWLCVDATAPVERVALAGLVGRGPVDDRHTLASLLAVAFEAHDTDTWLDRLDAAGVPAEASRPGAIRGLWDDEDLRATARIVGYPHPTLGSVEQVGHLVELSATPGVIQGVAPLVGQHSREILAGVGYRTGDIDALLVAGVVHQTG